MRSSELIELDRFEEKLSCLGVIQTLSVLEDVRALREEYSRGEKKRSSRGVPDELILRGVSTIPPYNVRATITDLWGMSNNRSDRSSLKETQSSLYCHIFRWCQWQMDSKRNNGNILRYLSRICDATTVNEKNMLSYSCVSRWSEKGWCSFSRTNGQETGRNRSNGLFCFLEKT